MVVSRRHRRRWRLLAGCAAAAVTLSACAPGYARVEGAVPGEFGAAAECDTQSFRLSHQWPAPTDDSSDFRSQLAQDFADRVGEATDGQIRIQVFPGNTLAKATEQYDAMMAGSIDGSVFPLDYAAGQVPQWGITLMPGLVRDHEMAQAWDEGAIGEAVDDTLQAHGLIALTHVWNAGGIGTQGAPIVRPEDMPGGTTMRAAGEYVELMLEEAGAGITSLPSSEIYTAMQTGILDAAVTSTSSFASYNLQEQLSSYTSPTENTFWFMYEPLVMSGQAWESMCADQQATVRRVGEELQEQAYSASRADDERVEQLFRDAGVEVVTMDDAAYEEWLVLARDQWESFANQTSGGRELLDLALELQEERS